MGSPPTSSMVPTVPPDFTAVDGIKVICELIVRNIALDPKDVVFSWKLEDTRLTLNVEAAEGVDPSRLGALIGKKGATIVSLHRIVQVISLRHGLCVHVTVQRSKELTNGSEKSETSGIAED